MAVKSKIRSQRGATLMAALLFFLVAAVCGSIILAAATATVSRVKNQAKDAQAYYAVTSAAELIRDDLMESEWEIELTEVYEKDKSEPTTKINKVELNESAKSTFVNDLKASTFDDNIPVVSSDIIITATVPELPTVYAKVTNANKETDDMILKDAKDDLKMTITLTNYGYNGQGKFNDTDYRETDEEGNQLYWVTVELRSVRVPNLDAVVSDSRVGKEGEVVRKIGLTWGDPVIKKVER